MVKKSGAALLVVVIIMSAAFLLAIVILNGQIRNTKDLKYVKSDTQAYYSAESGVNYAMAQRIKDIKSNIKQYSFSSYYNTSDNAKNDINAAVNTFLASAVKQLTSPNGNLFNDNNAGYEETYTSINKIYRLKSGLENTIDIKNPNYNVDLPDEKIYLVYDVNSKGYYSYGDRINYVMTGQFKICIQVNYSIKSSTTGSGNNTTTIYKIDVLNINLSDTENDYKIYNKNIGTTS